MKTRSILRFLGFLAVALCVRADIVVTTPAVGYEKLLARGASDSWLSLSLVRRPVLSARVAAVASNVITLSTTDASFAPNASSSYYLQFVSGNLAGLCFPIQSNAGAVLTLDTEGIALTSHPLGIITAGTAGDIVRIRPFWRVADVFGTAENAVKIEAVSSLSSGPYKMGDALLLPDVSSPGLDKPPAASVYYVIGTGWRAVGSEETDAASTLLPPGRPFVFRRHSPLTGEVLVLGDAAMDPFCLKIPAVSANSEIDVPVALGRAAAIRLQTSGLFSTTGTGGVVAASPTATADGDQVLEFDSTREGMAFPAAHRYRVVASHWVEGGVSAEEHTLELNVGYILRLRGERAAQFWVQPAVN